MKERLEIAHKMLTIAEHIEALVMHGKPIPADWILEHNKLLNDYNEILKTEPK